MAEGTRYELPAVAQTLRFEDMVAILETLQGVMWTYEDGEIDPDKAWGGEQLNDIGQAMARLAPTKEVRVTREFDIPVLFQVRAESEQEAARYVGDALAEQDRLGRNMPGYDTKANETEIESWFLPNHKDVDGNDIPVTVVLVVDEEKMAERRGIVNAIADTVGIPRP